jgi:SAM-dependent methyltransferase
MTDAQHYTFGDDEVAAQRLLLLAAAFEPSTRAWLQSLGIGCRCAVDLGCGPGLTTALLAEVLAPAELYGIDQSERLLARARANALASSGATTRTQFLAADVTVAPLPVPPADVIYARFLLTHLSPPAQALQTWARALRPGGVLLLEEVAGLESAEPALTRYYELVAELQAHYGQTTYIGGELATPAAGSELRVRRARVAALQLPAALMARLHALNIRSWGRDEHARRAFDAAELAELARTLEQIAAGARSAPVLCRMAQVVFERSGV